MDDDRGLRESIGAAMTETAVAFGGLLAVTAVLAVVAWIGVGPEVPAVGFLAGPAITAGAALLYGAIARAGVLGASDAPDAPKLAIGPTIKWSAVCLVAALAGSVAIGQLLEWIGLEVREQPGIQKIIDAAKAGEIGLELIVLMFSAAVLAPLAEEWLFRRLLFRRITLVSTRTLAYGFSAVLFALIHGNPQGMVVYLWLGLVFAMALERTGRYGAAVFVHFGNNAFALALLLLT